MFPLLAFLCNRSTHTIRGGKLARSKYRRRLGSFTVQVYLPVRSYLYLVLLTLARANKRIQRQTKGMTPEEVKRFLEKRGGVDGAKISRRWEEGKGGEGYQQVVGPDAGQM